MSKNKIKNIIPHNSLEDYHAINDFYTATIKRKIANMPIEVRDKIQIIDELIHILKNHII